MFHALRRFSSRAGDKLPRFHARIDFGESRGLTHVEAAPEMHRTKIAGMVEPGGGRQLRQRLDRRAMKIVNALGFVRHDESAAARRILCRNAGRTAIGVAAERLDAAE